MIVIHHIQLLLQHSDFTLHFLGRNHLLLDTGHHRIKTASGFGEVLDPGSGQLHTGSDVVKALDC